MYGRETAENLHLRQEVVPNLIVYEFAEVGLDAEKEDFTACLVRQHQSTLMVPAGAADWFNGSGTSGRALSGIYVGRKVY
jgi:hypothetical protein